jgi:hypothetical protein
VACQRSAMTLVLTWLGVRSVHKADPISDVLAVVYTTRVYSTDMFLESRLSWVGHVHGMKVTNIPI